MNRCLKVLIVIVTSLALPLAAHAQSWSTEFSAPPGGQGLNYWGSALCVYQFKLVVGGSFTQAGSVSANRVAAWDGTQWSAFGSGIGNGWVEALTEYNGELIAAGDFTQAGGNPAMGLARWNGMTWSALTPPIATPFFLAVHAHAGLLFVNTGDENTSSLSWWNGSTWSSVVIPAYSPATYYSPEIYEMASYQGRLNLAGGVLTRNPGEVNYEGFLFSWDGSSFQGPGYVFDDAASCLQVHNQQLHIGGFWSVGGSPPATQPGIAIWDGSTWVPFGRDDVAGPFSLDTYHNRLVVGNWRVTSYLGATEIPLGINTVLAYDTQVYNGDLYVTGSFTIAGISTPSYYIAKWSEPTTGVRGNVPLGLSVVSAPNPFNPSVTLSVHVPARAAVTVTICDAAGRKVRSIAMGTLDAGAHDVTWDGTSDAGEELASGVYFARVAAGSATVTRKLTLLK